MQNKWKELQYLLLFDRHLYPIDHIQCGINIIPSFVPMDLNMYFTYYFGIKEFFGRKERHAIDII